MKAYSRILIASVFLLAVISILGCSGGGISPTTPGLTSEYSPEAAYDGGNRSLWGFWMVSVDESHSRFDLTPVRNAAFHLNVRQFIEESPCSNCLNILNVQPSGEGSLLVDIELRHPFPGADKFTGFDVRGIFMAGGSLEFTEWSLSMAEPGTDPYLKNPDGVTQLYNPSEFAPGSMGQPIFEYSKGKYAAPSGFDATLNAFKTFDSSDNRHYFASGDAIVVQYDVKPVPGAFHFGYAIDACWHMPGWTPPAVPDDFVISANCLEAYLVNVDISKGMTDEGGNADVTIDVYDWQGLQTIDACSLIAPDLFNGEIVCTEYQDTIGFRRYTTEISNDNSASAGTYPLLVKVTDVGSDPKFGTVGAYQVGWAQVEAYSLPENTIFVDDSSVSPTEDGTPEHPYKTINDGVANCPAGWQVWVDDSGDPYEGSVVMLDDVHVKGANWDLSDGGMRPTIEPPDVIWANSFNAYEVSNFTIETFDCNPGGGIYFIDIQGCGGVTIRDCLFTGNTDSAIIPCNITGSVDVSVEYCRFDDFDKVAEDHGMSFVNAVRVFWSDGVTIRNCSFSDFRESEDEGSKMIDVIHVEYTTNLAIHNNQIFSIVPLAGVGMLGAVLLEGIHTFGCDSPVVYNNTISMIDSSEAFFINQCFAYFLRQSPDGIFYNNIATHIYSSGWAPDNSPLARGVQSCETELTCDYTCIFDIKVPSGEGAHYFQLAEPGVGCLDVAPGYVAPELEDFDIAPGGPGQMGHPDYVDWDDSGSPSGDPANLDPDTRSRMGCHGGPDGETVGLLT